jgi:hypothetical protein
VAGFLNAGNSFSIDIFSKFCHSDEDLTIMFMTAKKIKKPAASTAKKLSRDEWFLMLLNDSAMFTKTRATLKPLIDAGIAKRHDLKPEQIKCLGRILEAIANITARTYLDRVWENRKESFDHYFEWFVKEAVKGFDIAADQVDSEPLRERLREAMESGCSDSHCGCSH